MRPLQCMPCGRKFFRRHLPQAPICGCFGIYVPLLVPGLLTSRHGRPQAHNIRVHNLEPLFNVGAAEHAHCLLQRYSRRCCESFINRRPCRLCRSHFLLSHPSECRAPQRRSNTAERSIHARRNQQDPYEKVPGFAKSSDKRRSYASPSTNRSATRVMHWPNLAGAEILRFKTARLLQVQTLFAKQAHRNGQPPLTTEHATKALKTQPPARAQIADGARRSSRYYLRPAIG